MKLLRLLVASLSIAAIAACCGAWLLFGTSAFGWSALSVPTGSMQPVLPVGSLVIIHRVSVPDLRVGDIITYQNPLDTRKTITHRIVRTYLISGHIPGFITKGDANTVPDVPIPGGSVQGKVAWHVPYLGGAIAIAKTWVGITALVYVPAILITIEELMRLNNYYKLTLPYRLASYRKRHEPSMLPKMLTIPGAVVGVVITMAVWQPMAAALMNTGPVRLAPNRIALGAVQHSCQAASETNVSISSISSQTASTGSATVSGSTSAGSARSGDAANNSSIDVTMHVSGGC